MIPISDSEADCKLSCGSFDGCSFYTYFFPNDTLTPSSCFLLTEYLEPIQECSTCSSGPGDCGADTTAAPATTTASSNSTAAAVSPLSWLTRVFPFNGLPTNIFSLSPMSLLSESLFSNVVTHGDMGPHVLL